MVKYSWTFNGSLYNILRVPIMSISKERGVDINRLVKFVETFNEDKAKQYFPRIFIGHHSECGDDRIGVGFLDNIILDYINDVPTLFADFVDIPYYIFAKIKTDISYPYHSVEINDKEICGLALLDSLPPYFKFPRMILENEGLEHVLNFSRKQRNFRSYSMDELKENEQKKDESKVETKTEETSNHMSEEMELLKSILTELRSLAENVMKQKSTFESPEIKANEPTSVAYQDKSIKDKFSALETEIHHLRVAKRVDDLVERKNMSRVYLEKTLGGFSNNKDREHFLSVLESTEASNAFATSVSKVNYASDFSPEKYSSAGKDVALARRASESYQQTKNHPDKRIAEKFCAIWPSKDRFIEHILAMSVSNPDYLNTLTVKE